MGGLPAVAVVPIAKALGVTKGSFYWHFENREALIEAMLDAFEARTSALVRNNVTPIRDPRERLIALIQAATSNENLRTEAALASIAAAGVEPIASRYEKVIARRILYLIRLYQDAGLTKSESKRWANVTHTWFLGLLQRLLLDKSQSSPSAVRRETALVIDRLIPRGDDADRDNGAS